MTQQPLLIAGIIADTHVPDRARELHPLVLSTLKQANVNIILHAGDISGREVLKQLEQLAPVKAVRGNRDWAALGYLPLVSRLELAGVVVALLHGHGGWVNYFIDKYHYLRNGYQLERLKPKLVAAVPDAQVVVFGHTHRAVNEIIDNRLIFNPGSAALGVKARKDPSIGLLRFYPGKQVAGEIITLSGYHLENGHWLLGLDEKS